MFWINVWAFGSVRPFHTTYESTFCRTVADAVQEIEDGYPSAFYVCTIETDFFLCSRILQYRGGVFHCPQEGTAFNARDLGHELRRDVA